MTDKQKTRMILFQTGGFRKLCSDHLGRILMFKKNSSDSRTKRIMIYLDGNWEYC